MSNIITLDYMAAQKHQALNTLATKKGKLNAILDRSDLILYADLEKNKNTYVFRFNQNEVGTQPNQLLLGKDEYFWPTHVSLRIQKYDTTKNGWAGTREYTYVEEKVFSAAGEAEALRAIYNSLLLFKVDSLEIASRITTHHMEYTPPVQLELDGSNNVITVPQVGPTIEEKGYHRLHQDMLYHGQDSSNRLELHLSAQDTLAIEGDVSGNFRNRIILKVHGWLHHHSFENNEKFICLGR